MNLRAATKGFTLVELLVVTGLMAGVFALVVAAMRPTRNAQARTFAQAFVSELLQTQTRAIKSDVGASLLLQPSGGSTPGDQLGTALFQGSMMPLISASTGTTQLVWTNTNSGTCRIYPKNADVVDVVQQSYKIRFGQISGITQAPFEPQTPWIAVVASSYVTSGEAQLGFAYRANYGHSRWTAAWPPPANIDGEILSYEAQIARYPAKGPTAVVAPNAVAVDLRYSGLGDDWLSSDLWACFRSRGSIGIVFDTKGQVEAVMQQVLEPARSASTLPITPTALIYFLIAGREDILSDWQRALASEESMWVVVDPRSGRAHAARNVPQTFTFVGSVPSGTATAWNGAASPTDIVPVSTVLRAARAKARTGLGVNN